MVPILWVVEGMRFFDRGPECHQCGKEVPVGQGVRVGGLFCDQKCADDYYDEVELHYSSSAHSN